MTEQPLTREIETLDLDSLAAALHSLPMRILVPLCRRLGVTRTPRRKVDAVIAAIEAVEAYRAAQSPEGYTLLHGVEGWGWEHEDGSESAFWYAGRLEALASARRDAAKRVPRGPGVAKRRVQWPDDGARIGLAELAAWVERHAYRVWNPRRAAWIVRDMRTLMANGLGLERLDRADPESLSGLTLVGSEGFPLGRSSRNTALRHLRVAYAAYTAEYRGRKASDVA